MSFLDKGSRIKHRNLQFVARIQEIACGRYTLVWDKLSTSTEREHLFRYALRGTFSASDLVRDFVPVVEDSKWDRILDGVSPIDDTPYTPKSESHPLRGI